MKVGVGEIESERFDDIKLAKQHVAFKAISLFHHHGLLDENLMPK
jgi:hypothetical protein